MTTSGPSPDATYAPGSWVALAGRDVWLLVNIDPASSVVQEWWSVVRDGASVDDVLGLFAQEGLRTVSSFALVGFDDGSGSLALRGGASIEVFTRDRSEVFSAATEPTWLRVELDSPVSSVIMRSSDATASAVRFPLASGVSVASSIEVSFVDHPAVPEGSSADGGTLDERPGKPIVTAAPNDSSGDVGPLTSEQPKPQPEPATTLETEETTATETDFAVSPVVVADSEPEAVDAVAAESERTPTFDHLFGATQRPPIATAPEVVVPDSLEPPSVPDPRHAVEAPVVGGETLTPTDTMYPRPSKGQASSSLIESLPWEIDEDDDWPGDNPPAATSHDEADRSVDASRSETASPANPFTQSDRVDSVDATVNRAALLAAAAAEEPMPIAGPTVQATKCLAGHLSPPYAESCRICGDSVPAQNAFTAPRPLLGALRLSTGDVVTLDRGVLLGRDPGAPVGNDPDRPHVVKLSSPERDLSRTHVEVRLDGWHVLVVDLDSTNGTVVTLPGQPPVRLRANDPTPIEPGTVVSLADEVTFTYEISS